MNFKLGRAVGVFIVLLFGAIFGSILLFFGAMGGDGVAEAQCNPLGPAVSGLGTGAPQTILIDGKPPDNEQLYVAGKIVAIARSRQLTENDAIIGLMVGLQEARLRNPAYGHLDSVGWAQQRPSWGTFEQRMDLDYSINKFYDSLVGVENRATMPRLEVAIRVQRPSRAAYEKSFNSWLAVALQLLGKPGDAATQLDVACPTDAGIPGKVTIAAGANKPGKPLQPDVLIFLERISSKIGRPLIVTTGTDHSFLTKSGNVSDHVGGNAADLGMTANSGTRAGPVGDQIAAACLELAGDSPQEAARLASLGGLWNRSLPGIRIQCIWKTNTGGDHYGHVHVAVKPTFGTIQPPTTRGGS